MICLYVVLLLGARYMDKADLKKYNLVPLIEKWSICDYFYEVIVFTGDIREAATNSNVKLCLNGDKADSQIRHLNENQKKVFRKSGIDSFVIGETKYIFCYSILKDKYAF